MNIFRFPWLYFALYVLGFVGISTLTIEAFPVIVAVYTAIFVLYIQLINSKRTFSLFAILCTFLAIRLPFFFELPHLSDDYFRYIWDGMMMNEGFNPFGRIPSQERLSSMKDPIFAAKLLSEMNSANMASIYPTYHQIIFGFSYLLAGAKELNGVNTMRAFIVSMELCFLIYSSNHMVNYKRICIAYLCNPLVVLEGVGNLHFEAVMIPWVATGIYMLYSKRIMAAGISLGGGILIKLSPLLLVPAFLMKMDRKDRLEFTLTLVVVMAIFVGMIEPWNHFGNLIKGYGLYFTSFEFNGSVVSLVNGAFMKWLGYCPSVIGPGLAVCSFILILFISYRFRKAAITELALIIYLVFLLFTPSVHPWYLLPVIYLAIVSERKYVLVWSFTAILTYSHFFTPIGPKAIFIIAEYSLLIGSILLEAKRRPWLQDELRG